jgi:large subunit ribosomal protein L17
VRHARAGKKLGRDSAHRKALYSNLAGALIEHGRIKTTVTKAKAVKPLAEQMITLGRRGDLHARRQATAFLRSRDVVHKLFADVAPLFKDRPGGYTRIVKIGPRPGDAAEMAYLELVDEEYVATQREERTPAPAVPVEAAEELPETEAEAVEAPAVEDTAVEDTAVEDSALEDTAVDDTALEDSALEDSAVEEPEAEGDEPTAAAEDEQPQA